MIIEKDVSNIKNNTNNKNDKNENQMESKSNNKQTKNIFHDYKPGVNVQSDGICGLYAICNALNDQRTNQASQSLYMSHMSHQRVIYDCLPKIKKYIFPNIYFILCTVKSCIFDRLNHTLVNF